MIKVLLETSFCISYFRPRNDNDLEKERNSKAILLMDYFLKNQNKYEIFYSERTKNELENDQDKIKLEQFRLVGSHILNLPWEQIDLTWDKFQKILGK